MEEKGMRRARKHMTVLVTALVLVGGMVSCENWMIQKLLEKNEPSDGGGSGGGKNVAVERVEITNGTERGGGVGSTLVIKTEVYPAAATNRKVEWRSDDSDIADVVGNESGATVHLSGVGSTKIRVKTAEGGKEAVCTITVVSAGSEVVVTGIKLNVPSLPLQVGGHPVTLTATINPGNATDHGIDWSSSADGVVSVENGMVRALVAGTATITARSTSNPAAIDTCLVTATENAVAVTGISLDKYSLSMEEGDSAVTLVATPLPISVTGQTIHWESSNESVATVNESSGEVTPVGLGNTDITASISGITPAVCRVTVESRDLARIFGTIYNGANRVSDTFTAIHEYLKAFSGNPDLLKNGKIKLGDYVELANLAVAAYPSGQGEITAGSLVLQPNRRRLMVVGINSFNPGANGKASYVGGVTPAIAHIVMQFKDFPSNHYMNGTSTNTGGYKESSMRKYLVAYGGSTGVFSIGLEAAGVPLSNGAIIWTPKRYVANGGSGSPAVDGIEDKIWLPTAREMFNSPSGSAICEAENNQAYLEYYDSPARRKKSSGGYWEASPYGGGSTVFCTVNSDGSANLSTAGSELGVAPAFCIK
jgi:uncharacterized protein YjdB